MVPLSNLVIISWLSVNFKLNIDDSLMYDCKLCCCLIRLNQDFVNLQDFRVSLSTRVSVRTSSRCCSSKSWRWWIRKMPLRWRHCASSTRIRATSSSRTWRWMSYLKSSKRVTRVTWPSSSGSTVKEKAIPSTKRSDCAPSKMSSKSSSRPKSSMKPTFGVSERISEKPFFHEKKRKQNPNQFERIRKIPNPGIPYISRGSFGLYLFWRPIIYYWFLRNVLKFQRTWNYV